MHRHSTYTTYPSLVSVLVLVLAVLLVVSTHLFCTTGGQETALRFVGAAGGGAPGSEVWSLGLGLCVWGGMGERWGEGGCGDGMSWRCAGEV